MYNYTMERESKPPLKFLYLPFFTHKKVLKELWFEINTKELRKIPLDLNLVHPFFHPQEIHPLHKTLINTIQYKYNGDVFVNYLSIKVLSTNVTITVAKKKTIISSDNWEIKMTSFVGETTFS